MQLDERKQQGTVPLGETPPNDADLAALELALLREGRWEDLIRLAQRRGPGTGTDHLLELLEREAAHADSPERAAEALVAQGKLLVESLGRVDRALLAFQRALRLRPDHPEALARSRETLLALGRVEAAFDAAVALAETGADPATAAAAFLEVARAAMARPILHAVAREAALRAREGDPAAAAELLARLEAAATGFREEARALRSRAMEERDGRAAARLYLEIAELHAAYDGHATGPARVHENLEQAFLLWPGMPDALDFLERHSASAADPRGLAADLERFAAATADPRGRQEILLRLAAVQLTRRNDAAASLAALERAFALDPSRPEAAIGLVEALHEAGRHAEAADVLERHLGTIPDPGAAAELRLRLAMLLADHVGDLARARAEVEQVLAAVPGHARADELLERILEKAPDAGARAALLERRAARADSAATRATLLERAAAGLPAERGADRLRLLGEALAAAPDRPGILAALERVAAATGLAGPFVDRLRTAAAGAPREVALPLLRRAAEVLSADLGRHGDAAAVWREVTALAPEDDTAQAELERCLVLAGDFEAIAERLRAALAAAGDPAERRLLLDRLARHYETAARDPAAAADVYRELLAADPGDPVVLGKLAATLGALERWEEQLDALRQLAEQPGPAGLAARARCAALLAERLDRPEEAVELYAGLFAAEPEFPGVVPALERLLSAGVAARRIAGLLAPHYAARGDWSRHLQMLDLGLAGERDPAARRALLLSIAAVHEESLGDPRAAFDAALRAFALDPSADGLTTRLERLAAAAGTAAELAAAYRRAWDAAPPELARELCVRVVALAEGPLADPALAIAAWRRRFELDPADDRALEALATRAAAEGRWEDAAALVGRRIELAGSADRPALERLRADYLAKAGKAAVAAGGYRAALAAGAPEAEVLPLLAEAIEAAGEREELGPVLDRLAALTREAGDDAGALRLELRAAALVEERYGPGAAIERFGAILAREPSEAAACAALERYLEDPELGPAAARALAPAHEANRDYRRLAEVLAVEARGAVEPAARAGLLARLARVQAAELRDSRAAFDALLAAVREMPDDAVLRAELLEAARDAGAVEEGARAMAELALSLTARPDLAVALERELAFLAEHELDDLEAATGHLERILALSAGDEDALRNLCRLRRTLGRWGPLREACLALEPLAGDPAERVALLREAGTIALERLADPAAAYADFSRLVSLAPAADDAWAALDRLAGMLGRPAERARAIAARRDLLLAGGPPAGLAAERLRELTYRLAVLTRDELGDPAAAVELFARVLALEPADDGAREALEPLARTAGAPGNAAYAALDAAYAATGEHGRRAVLREARLELADGAGRERLWEELRTIQEVDLGRPELAFLTACRAFVAGADRERLLPHLERLAREVGSLEELADVYEQAAPAAGADAAGLLGRAARIRETELHDPDGAIRLWREALAAAPADRAALDALARLYEDRRQGAELAEVYRRNVELAEGEERVAWLVRLGRLAAGVLGDEARAVAAYREALALDPGHLPALEALDALLWKDRQARPGEVVEVLRRRADLAPEGSAEKGRLLLRIARVLEEHASAQVDAGNRKAGFADALAAAGEALAHGEPAEAVAHLERLLARDETRVGAALLLEPVYRSRGDKGRLADLLDAIRLGPEAGEGRQARLAELIELRESLGDRRAAFSAAIALFREAPGDAAVRERLVALAEAIGGHEELAAVLEDQLEGRPDGDPLVVPLLRLLAPLDEGPLGRPGAAATAWERLYALTGEAAILDRLEELYRREGRLAELVTVYRRRIRLAPDDAAKRELGISMANLMERLGDKDGAVDALREILALDERDENALASLSRLLGDTGRWPELAELLARQIEVARERGLENEARELTYKLGRVRQVRLGDPAGALAVFREVLSGEPRHGRTLAALEELAGSDDVVAKALAAEVLAPIYEAEKDWPRLVQALEALVAAATAPEERARHLGRIAELYAGPIASPEMALVAAGRALRETPDDGVALARAIAVADAADLTDELAELLLAAADRATTDAGRLSLLREAARRLDAAGEASAARDAWKRVRILAADDDEALLALARLHRAAGEREAYLEILRTRLLRAEEPGLRRELLLALADAQEEAGDIAGALTSCRRVLEGEPLDPEALGRMDRLCTEAERWADLALVLEKEARGAADPAAKLPFQLRLAALKESRLLDREGALAIYGEILAAVPGQEEAVVRLEALLDRDPDCEGAARLLESAYLATGAWAKYAGVLDERAAATADPEARKAALLALAEVREKRQERPDLAFIALARAFRDDPVDATVRDELERVARDADSLEELAALFEEELPRIRAGSVAAGVALRLGSLAEDREGPEAARRWYERARELDPAVGARALPALDRLHKAAERWPELADVLEARAALEEDLDERVAVLFRLAALAEEKLGERDRAAAAYERIVELDGRHLPSLRALERLYEEAGRHDRLYEVLLAQRDATGDPASRDRLALRLAEVAAKGRKEPDRAIGHLLDLLAKNPRHDGALRALEGLYEETGRWRELASLLETRLSSTVEPREIARLHEKRGWVLSTKLAAGDEALRSYQAVLERDPRNRKALEAMRDLQREKGELEGLAATLRRLVPLQDDSLGVKRARLELARALAELGRREEAIDNARRTLDVEPHDEELLAGAEELLLAQAAFSDAVRAMELLASRLGPGRAEEAAELWGRIARLWEERLGRKEGAAQALEKVLELRPGDREAFEALRTLYRALADWRRMAIATERFAASIEAPEERLELLVELARIHEERLGQKEVALAKLGAALEHAPDDEAIRRSLRRLADDTGGHEELAMLLESVADSRPRGESAASLYLELGRLQDEVLDDAKAAEASFRRILEFQPLHAEATDALVRLFERRGEDRPYVLALEQKLEAVTTLEEKKAILHAIARAYDERLGDVEEAMGALRRALEFDPGDRNTVELLGELYRRERRFAELAELWARARDVAADLDERVERQLAIAALVEDELADVDGAVAAYHRALELDPGCEPALDALERLFTRLDRPAELLRVIERRRELVADGQERARLLLREAAIHEEARDDPERAIACFEELLRIDPENLAAVRGLERLLARTGDVERQIAALERHLALVERDPASRAEAVELHVRIGQRFLEELDRPERAETWFARALELDADCRPALSGLARIHERAGNWPLALEHLRREARLAGAAAEAVELFFRAGQLEEERLGDAAAARRSYERALEIDPGHLPSLRALRGLLEREGDRDGSLELLIQEATHAVDPAEKARLWTEVGRIQLETRDDREAAIRALEEARRNDPAHLAAARGLADLYVAAEDWARAEGCLDVVCEGLAASGDPEAERELLQRSYRLGYIAQRLGNAPKALACYRRAYAIDPTHLPAAEGLARLLAEAGELDEARNVYQGILLHHREELSDPELVEFHYAVGDLRRRLGEPEAALKSLRSALELDPYHPEALRAFVALTEEGGRFDVAFASRRRLLEVLEGAERRAALLETAAIARDRLADPYQAIDCLQAALKLDGNDAASLAALAALYRETRQALPLRETLERLVALSDLEREEAVNARLELAGLYRGELRDEPDSAKRAVEHLEAALDLDWKRAEAFEALETTLGAARDWTGLEAAYVRMLKRIPKEEGTRAARVLLYRTLGDLYLRALRNPAAALEAYRAVTLIAPDDGKGLQAFAELLGKKPGAEAEAIVAHRAALRHGEPGPSARALVRLHARQKEYDRALVAAQVVTHLLGQGGADEAGILGRLQRFAKASATRALGEAHWSLLAHEAVRTPVAELLGLLQEHAGALFAVDPAKLELAGKPTPLESRDRVDLGRSELFFVGAYLQVARALGVTPLPLYQVAAAKGLHLVGTHPAALVAGEELFGTAPKKKELYYLLAKRLVFARPGLTMAALHRAESLDLLLQAAVTIAEPGYRPVGDGREIDRLRRRIEKALSPEAKRAVAAAGARWLRDPAKPDVRSYLQGAELTATRAAALLAADLEVAVRCLEADPGTAARLSVEERKRDLVSFCLGEEFFQLREALGLAVEIPG